jgi:hypothetical protein
MGTKPLRSNVGEKQKGIKSKIKFSEEIYVKLEILLFELKRWLQWYEHVQRMERTMIPRWASKLICAERNYRKTQKKMVQPDTEILQKRMVH